MKLGNLNEVVRVNENEPDQGQAVLSEDARRQAADAQGHGAICSRLR